MEIEKIIKSDCSKAMIEKDAQKLSFLRVVVGELDRVGKNPSDSETLKVLQKMQKNAIEMNSTYEQKILNKYLPTMLSESEIKNIVNSIILEDNITSLKELGKIMSKLKTHEKSSLIDNKMASKIVKEILC